MRDIRSEWHRKVLAWGTKRWRRSFKAGDVNMTHVSSYTRLRARFEQVALRAAAGRLQRQGLIVEFDTGIVRYPSREAALNGRLTPESIRDARLISRKHLIAASLT